VVSLRKNYRLLLADDDPGFRETLRLIFEPHFSLLEAASGEEAIEISGRSRVDIALLDMHMQTMTGLETLKIFKTIHAAAPCILITADASEELQRTATAADAYSVLHKPVSRLELVTTVSTALVDVYDDPEAFSEFPD